MSESRFVRWIGKFWLLQPFPMRSLSSWRFLTLIESSENFCSMWPLDILLHLLYSRFTNSNSPLISVIKRVSKTLIRNYDQTFHIASTSHPLSFDELMSICNRKASSIFYPLNFHAWNTSNWIKSWQSSDLLSFICKFIIRPFYSFAQIFFFSYKFQQQSK